MFSLNCYFIHNRNYEVGGEAANIVSGKLRISDELGFLVLGKVDQEYICDAELREILATAELNSDKVAVFKEQQLRLITSVVYSSRFQHKGIRMEKVRINCIGIFACTPNYNLFFSHIIQFVKNLNMCFLILF